MSGRPKGKKATHRNWGGRRAGAGRPKGSGQGPSPYSRRNRVAVMFADKELQVLKRIARTAKEPISTVGYRIIARRLARA